MAKKKKKPAKAGANTSNAKPVSTPAEQVEQVAAKPGRPTKFSVESAERVFALAREGKTDKQMAKALGVTEQTLNNWKAAHPEFFESLKEAKAISDGEVERSLYERALGYSHPAIKIMQNEGEPVIVHYVQHFPPDPTSAIFWLKNRKPDIWRDRVVHAGDRDNPIVMETRAIVVPKKDAVGFGAAQAKAAGASTPRSLGAKRTPG